MKAGFSTKTWNTEDVAECCDYMALPLIMTTMSLLVTYVVYAIYAMWILSQPCITDVRLWVFILVSQITLFIRCGFLVMLNVKTISLKLKIIPVAVCAIVDFTLTICGVILHPDYDDDISRFAGVTITVHLILGVICTFVFALCVCYLCYTSPRYINNSSHMRSLNES